MQQPDVLAVDLENVGFNPSTMTVEGLHPNNNGAAVIGAVVGQALATIGPAVDSDNRSGCRRDEAARLIRHRPDFFSVLQIV
jgi:hypothetical protein